MGKNIYATVLMIVGWLCALGILHAGFTGRLLQASLLGIVVITTMVLVRDFARLSYLGAHFHPRDLENAKEASPLIVFLIIFIIGLASIYYMIRLASKPKIQ